MADESSFDVVSKVDLQMIDDAMNAASKEMTGRFDFRGSVSKIEFDKKTGDITLTSDDEGKLKSVIDIVQGRLVKRGIDLKALDYQKIEPALGGAVRQVVKIIQGLSSEKAKLIVADIKASKIKVTPSIQSEQVRVTSKSKDALQEVMALVRSKSYGIPVQFVNFR
jgi:uncharacterized protein YajQ (UPF0234 family)